MVMGVKCHLRKALCPSCHWTMIQFLWLLKSLYILAELAFKMSSSATLMQVAPGVMETLIKDAVFFYVTRRIIKPSSLSCHKKYYRYGSDLIKVELSLIYTEAVPGWEKSSQATCLHWNCKMVKRGVLFKLIRSNVIITVWSWQSGSCIGLRWRTNIHWYSCLLVC